MKSRAVRRFRHRWASRRCSPRPLRAARAERPGSTPARDRRRRARRADQRRHGRDGPRPPVEHRALARGSLDARRRAQRACAPDSNDTLVAEPVWSAEGVAAGNELKWLALHPRFASNRLVYLSYPKGGERGHDARRRARPIRRPASSTTSEKSSSPTLGKPAATWAARSCSAPTRRCTSRSAIAIGSAARAPRTTACA